VKTIVLPLLTALAAAIYLIGIGSNPPGFYIDESSIAYNAHTIATAGVDEHGVQWPLYFRAFGDYKNAPFIYALALLFWFTGPSIVVARLLSAIAVLAAAAVLGLLGARIGRSSTAGWATALSVLLTPWLFEVSRVALEVALYPVGVAVLLLLLRRANARPQWSCTDVVCIAGALAFLTYSYSIGRLLAPLFAVGLLLFCNRTTWSRVAATWAAYALLLLPLLLFARNNPGALTERFTIITWLKPQLGVAGTVREFCSHYFANLNVWRLLVSGDPNREQFLHIYGTELFFTGTFLFAVVGAVVVLRKHLRDPWWRFVCYGFVVAPMPASLTVDTFHTLRLIAVPVFLLVFAAAGIAWLLHEARQRVARVVFALLIASTAAEAAVLQWKFYHARNSPRRVHHFDARYRAAIFEPALAATAERIYLEDAPWIPGYIQAYWYATLAGVNVSRFVHLAPTELPPPNALVISTDYESRYGELLARVWPYAVYRAISIPAARAPLPSGAFAAELTLLDGPQRLRRQQQSTYTVRVRNVSTSTWPAFRRRGGPLHVSLGNHWLDPAGATLINDDGRAMLRRDLAPGGEITLHLVVNAPVTPGDYVIEFDMLQEGVTWFGSQGSPTAKLPVQVD
jgi:4-amino-4-deoxy-L-arabinose transferase-like glycosyltransferase